MDEASSEAGAQAIGGAPTSLPDECEDLPVLEAELFVEDAAALEVLSGGVYGRRGGGAGWGETQVAVAFDEETGEEREVARFQLPSVQLGGNLWGQQFGSSEFSVFADDYFYYRVGEPYDVNNPTQNLYAVPLEGGEPVLVNGFSDWIGTRPIVQFHKTGYGILVDHGGAANCFDQDGDRLYDCSCDSGPNLALIAGPEDFRVLDVPYCVEGAMQVHATSKRAIWSSASGTDIECPSCGGDFYLLDLETLEHTVLGSFGALEIGGLAADFATLVTMGGYDFLRLTQETGELVGYVPLDDSPPYAELPCQFDSPYVVTDVDQWPSNFQYGDPATNVGFSMGVLPTPVDFANLSQHRSILSRHDVVTGEVRIAELSYLSGYVTHSDRYVYLLGIGESQLWRVAIDDYPDFFGD